MTTPPATRNSFKIESDKFDSSRNLFLGLSQAKFNPTRQTYAASRVLLFLQGDRRGRCNSFNNETKPCDDWLDVAEVHQQASKQATLSKAVDNERWKRKSYCQRRRDPLRCLANEAIAEASLTVLAITHWWTSGQANKAKTASKKTLPEHQSKSGKSGIKSHFNETKYCPIAKAHSHRIREIVSSMSEWRRRKDIWKNRQILSKRPSKKVILWRKKGNRSKLEKKKWL